MVLEAIYEPYFDTLNRSFGFIPNKGVHDAITTITSNYTNGIRIAIEGNVEAAYDTVSKKKLVEILSKKIKDKQFLDFIEKRFQYEYVEET